MFTVAADDGDILDAFRAGASASCSRTRRSTRSSQDSRIGRGGRSPVGSCVTSILIALGAHLVTTCGPTPAPPFARERDVLALLTEGYDNGEIGRAALPEPQHGQEPCVPVAGETGRENRVQAAVYATRHSLFGRRSACSPGTHELGSERSEPREATRREPASSPVTRCEERS